MPPDFELESTLGGPLGGTVAGVDEAGRGPWAGPVVAAAVVFEAGRIPDGLDDSKKLSAAARARLFEQIMATAQVGVGEASVDEIDDANILEATLRAMARAVAALPRRPTTAIVDGNQAPALDCPTETVVQGDGKSLSIAAASIVAKVTRDRQMAALAADFPGFGWDRNAGYGTAEHSRALENLGATPHHRKSFAPVRKRIAKDYSSTS
jgi:ribonuclease HII